jgi:hypothetical protein
VPALRPSASSAPAPRALRAVRMRISRDSIRQGVVLFVGFAALQYASLAVR